MLEHSDIHYKLFFTSQKFHSHFFYFKVKIICGLGEAQHHRVCSLGVGYLIKPIFFYIKYWLVEMSCNSVANRKQKAESSFTFLSRRLWSEDTEAISRQTRPIYCTSALSSQSGLWTHRVQFSWYMLLAMDSRTQSSMVSCISALSHFFSFFKSYGT